MQQLFWIFLALGIIIHLISWNIDGLCSKDRKHIAKMWINSLKSKPHVLCLQEIKVESFQLMTALEYILLGYNQTIA